MKRGKTTLVLIVTGLTFSTGVLSANSLSEPRERHDYRAERYQTATQRHKEIRQHSAERRRDRTRRATDRKVRQTRKLARAKRTQKRIDRKLHRKHAKRRNFRSLKEFKRQRQVHTAERRNRKGMRHNQSPHRKYFSDERRRESSRYRADRRSRSWQKDRYGEQWGEGRGYYERWKPRHAQRGYRHSRRSWYLTYLYERASFYDRHGYKYGYFSRRGFMFEGEFYRYDRHYTYRDRLRGRGLFERRYYRPVYSQFGDLFAEWERDGLYFYANFGW